MSARRRLLGGALAGLLLGAAPVELERDLVPPSRPLLVATASSTWPGWPASKVIDGDPLTSWFSAANESVARDKAHAPWLELTFPEPVAVRRVTVRGNHEPSWPTGYGIAAGTLELFDGAGKLLARQPNETASKSFDIAFRFKDPVRGVVRLRFTALADQGDQNPHGDVAVGELEVY